jgi:hypothetical protein
MKKAIIKNAANSMDETEYLLSSPANAAHLMESIAQLKAGEAKAFVTLDNAQAASAKQLGFDVVTM